MKSIALIAFTAVFLSNVAGAASDGGGDVTVGGTAPAVCSFRAVPRQLSATNMGLLGGNLGSGQIEVTQLVDATTARLKSASIQIEILGVCNGPHAVSLMTTNGGLVRADPTNPVGGNFLGHVNYRAEAQWGGKTIMLQTDTTAGKKSAAGIVAGANDGALTLKLTIDGTSNNMSIPTVEGVYSDALIIQIGLPL